MQGQKESEKVPVLLFLLEHNKFQEILKAILNVKIAKTLLDQYGHKQYQFSKAEQFRINNAVSRFSIRQVHEFIIRKQLIELKGSSLDSPKEYQNPHLFEAITRKLAHQKVEPLTRKVFWVQGTQIFAKPNFYEDLKLLDMAQDFLNVIEKDILRTQKEEHIKRQTREVLHLFSHYNPYVGYCQGMNTIISFLISRGFTCEQSFFIFKRVSEQLLPCDYYSNMDNVMAYTRIFYEMLHITHPKIYQHLKKIGEEMENTYVMMVSFVLQWFVCLFCNQNIYEPITEVIWDFFIVDGVVVLFKAALAYFDLLESVILQCTDFQSYNLMQKECIKQIKNVSYIRKRIIETSMSAPLLFLLKEKLIQPNPTQKFNRAQKKYDISFRKSCHRNLNVCFQVLEDNLQSNKSYDFFVFKSKDPVSIIPNYLDSLNKQYFKNRKQIQKVDSLIIGRIQHVCRSSSDTRTEGSMSDKNVPDSEIEVTPKKSLTSTPKSNKTACKDSEKKIREKVCEKIAMMAQKKPGIKRSESVIFMEEMVKNVSISNLLEFYDLDELFQ